MDIAMVMHEQMSRNINGGFQNVEYQIGKFSAMCTGILEKVVFSAIDTLTTTTMQYRLGQHTGMVERSPTTGVQRISDRVGSTTN
jgi:hypothetical protein